MTPHRLLRIVRQRLRALFRRNSVDEELSRELDFHLDQLIQEFVERGLSLEDARHAARRAIGNIPSLEEQCRDHRSVTWIHDVRRDVVYGVRMLRKNPGFTLVAVLSLALGIGGNTAIISVMDTVLRDNLPIPNDERVVVARTFPLDNPRQETHAPISDYYEWRDASHSFDQMGVSLGHQADFGADAAGTPAERVNGQLVTAEALAVLGVQPIIGRVFTVAEARIEAPERFIVISHRLWQRRFGGRAGILGEQVRLDRVNWTIIGVMPEGFRFPNQGADYWIPLRLDRSQRQSPQRFFVVTARLKDGVTIAQAQSDLDIIAARLARDDPDWHQGWGVRVKPLREAMLGWSVAPLVTLGSAVALVLLVACANLAGLLLSRGLVRMPEMAMRTALGAGRGRIVRQLLTESILLSVAGGGLGLLVAWGGIRSLVAMTPPPGGIEIVDVTLNLRSLIVTAMISIAAGILFGLAPALMAGRTGVTATLKESPNAGVSGLPPRFRGALVATQIAVTFVLLIGSGLLMRSFVQLVSRDLHFDPERLLTFEYHTPLGDYMHRQGSVGGLPHFAIDPPPSLALERVYQGLRALPGVESVAGVSFPLLNSVVLPSMSVSVENRTELAASPGSSGLSAPLAIGVGSVGAHIVSDRRALSAAYFLVTPGFFTSIKGHVVEGRDFAGSDTSNSEWVAIVNETAAARFWPGESPLNQRLRLTIVPEERPRRVIAVVRDIPLTRQSDPTPVIYTPYLQQPLHYPQPGANMLGRMTFMVRTTGDDPLALVPAARRVVAEVDPDRPLANVVTMEQQLASVVPRRGYMVLAMVVFAFMAMLLASIGIYGVISYSVTQRTREIGIRVALGAGAREVVGLVGGRALVLIGAGLSAGLGGALALTRVLQSQLWGVTPTDPATFAAAILLLVLVALGACVFPLRRATSVDPTIALRCE
jgi:putative ABC transport system permease protein